MLLVPFVIRTLFEYMYGLLFNCMFLIKRTHNNIGKVNRRNFTGAHAA